MVAADRAKQIKCKAIVNEDPTEKLIADLKAENERLKKQLAAGGGAVPAGGAGGDSADAQKLKQDEETMRKQLEENEKNMKLMQQSYEEKLAAAKAQVCQMNASEVPFRTFAQSLVFELRLVATRSPRLWRRPRPCLI